MALTITLAELIENVYRHAENDYPAYVIAQAHPNKNRLHLVIVDTGIGLYDSFRRSDSDSIRNLINKEKDALKMAIKPYVTSKTQRHSGYGLYIVSEMIYRHRGIFRLTSGKTTLLRSPSTGGWHKNMQTQMLDNLRWQGTELALQFNLTNPLPLLDVYNTLKSTEDEFFV